MSDQWLIRRASPSDLEAILALGQACGETPHWSPTQWLAALTDETATDLMRASFVAAGDEGILGFAVVNRVGQLAELENLAVSPSARRRGIGKALCRQIMHWARIGATELELEVRSSNESALALYSALGFAEQARRRDYYRNPTEDAVLMAAKL